MRAMTNIGMAKTNVSFDKQFNGYDKGQVDQYIKNLATAYQTAYDEYQNVCGKYNGLLDEVSKKETEEQGRPTADIISKTLINTELLAQKILDDAKAQTETIHADAQAEARRITDDAYLQRAEARLQAQKLLDDATAEAEAIKTAARQTFEEANAKEIAAQKALEQANESIAQLIQTMQGLITPALSDNR